MKQINNDHLMLIIDRLGEHASQTKNDELRGIASVGKKKSRIHMHGIDNKY